MHSCQIDSRRDMQQNLSCTARLRPAMNAIEQPQRNPTSAKPTANRSRHIHVMDRRDQRSFPDVIFPHGTIGEADRFFLLLCQKQPMPLRILQRGQRDLPNLLWAEADIGKPTLLMRLLRERDECGDVAFFRHDPEANAFALFQNGSTPQPLLSSHLLYHDTRSLQD